MRELPRLPDGPTTLHALGNKGGGEFCGLADAQDSFDPASALLAGIPLAVGALVRCSGNGATPSKATDLLRGLVVWASWYWIFRGCPTGSRATLVRFLVSPPGAEQFALHVDSSKDKALSGRFRLYETVAV